MAWRIEQAKTDRSSCRECEKPIAKGEKRFGRRGLGGGWYHLACAEAGKPRVFKTFMQSAPGKSKKKKPARNPELEARLAANPDDVHTRAVFADWLQSQGDPWGELIALELAGKPDEAQKLFKKHRGDLCGGFDADLFRWRGGFIDSIRLHPNYDRDDQRRMLDRMFAMPTTILVRELVLHVDPDARYVKVLARMPPTVKKLYIGLTNALGSFTSAHLEGLGFVSAGKRLDAEALAPLFATNLPRLRRLGIFMQIESPIPSRVLSALLDSQLVKQLESFIAEGTSDDRGLQHIESHRDKLAHIPARKLGFFANEAWRKLAAEHDDI